MKTITVIDRLFEFTIINGVEHFYELDSSSSRGMLFTSISEILYHFSHTKNILDENIGKKGFINTCSGIPQLVDIIGIVDSDYILRYDYVLQNDTNSINCHIDDVKVVGVDITDLEADILISDIEICKSLIDKRNKIYMELIPINDTIDLYIKNFANLVGQSYDRY